MFKSSPQGSRLRQGAKGFALYVTFVIVTAMLTRAFVFSGVTPCSLVTCVNISEEMCCSPFSTLNVKAARSSETSSQYLSPSVHVVTFQNAPFSLC